MWVMSQAHRLWFGLLALAAVAMWPGAVVAQEAAETSTKIEPAADPGQWIAVLVAMVLTICVLAISFLSPRRSHQD